MTEIKNINHDALRNALMLQIQNLTDPEKGTDLKFELEKSIQVCNLAENMINIDRVEVDDMNAKAKMMNAQNDIVRTMYDVGINFNDKDVKTLFLETK